MAWTTPPTYTTGQLMTAAIANAQWRDNSLVLKTTIDDNGKIKYSMVTKTGNYTLTATDDMILADATSGAQAQTLPSAASVPGKEFVIKKIDSSANAVTVTATIDGVVNYVLSVPNFSVTVKSNGTAWYIS